MTVVDGRRDGDPGRLRVLPVCPHKEQKASRSRTTSPHEAYPAMLEAPEVVEATVTAEIVGGEVIDVPEVM